MDAQVEDLRAARPVYNARKAGLDAIRREVDAKAEATGEVTKA